MRLRVSTVILAVFFAVFTGKTAVAEEIPPASLLGKYGFRAVNPTTVTACSRIDQSDLEALSTAYRCWTEPAGAFCTHLHQRLALLVYTSEAACWAGRQSFRPTP
jgi:hypothetical protein